MMDSPNKASIFYGPILLAGTESTSLSALREITLSDEDLGKTISGDPSKLQFKIEGENFTLKPFWEYINDRYSVYYDVTLSDLPYGEDAPDVTATTEKGAYGKNEVFEVTITTPDSVIACSFTNEYGNDIGKSFISKTDNGDGTITWKYAIAIGSKGDRIVTVMINEGEDWIYGTEFNVKIADVAPVEPVAAEIYSASLDDGVILSLIHI